MQDGSLSLCMLCALVYCHDGRLVKACNLQLYLPRFPALLTGQRPMHIGVTCTSHYRNMFAPPPKEHVSIRASPSQRLPPHMIPSVSHQEPVS